LGALERQEEEKAVVTTEAMHEKKEEGRRGGTGGRRAGTPRKTMEGVCVPGDIGTGGARGGDERGDRTAEERQNGGQMRVRREGRGRTDERGECVR
jgi:hypothetical protein